MTTQRDSFLQEVQNIRTELNRLLEGMDYCLDWKPNPQEWCAREIIYHMLDTPKGGFPAILKGVLQGKLEQYSIRSGDTNMTPERQEKDAQNIRKELESFLNDLTQVLSSTSDAELKSKKTKMHSITRGTTEERTAEMILERQLMGHWREHLNQLAALREMLGL